MYWKCDFPTTPHVRPLLVGWRAGRYVIGRQLTLPCSYRSACIEILPPVPFLAFGPLHGILIFLFFRSVTPLLAQSVRLLVGWLVGRLLVCLS